MDIVETIYLDYQASTPVDPAVLSEMLPYFRGSIGNPHSLDHSVGWKAAQAVENAAQRVAKLIGADDDEIVFTSGATEANNLALLGLGINALEGDRNRIIVSAIEHKCILEISRILQRRFDYQVDLLPVDSVGRVDHNALSELLDEDVLFVSIMVVNNEIGTIQDIPTLSQLIASCGAIFHCDGAQAPCAIELDSMSNLVDLLSLSGHKMYGPQGIGALYIRRDLQNRIEPLIYGGGQQRNIRSGTLPVPLCVGMGAAAEQIQSAEHIHERENLRERTEFFVNQLMELPHAITINGPDSNMRHPGNANICFEELDARDLLNLLQPGIAASTGSACSSGIHEPSHVLQAIGLTASQAASAVRISPGRDTTIEYIDEAIFRISECLKKITSR